MCFVRYSVQHHHEGSAIKPGGPADGSQTAGYCWMGVIGWRVVQQAFADDYQTDHSQVAYHQEVVCVYMHCCSKVGVTCSFTGHSQLESRCKCVGLFRACSVLHTDSSH